MIFLLIVGSCHTENQPEKQTPNSYDKILGGEHLLRKFTVNTVNSTRTEGWYFLVGGEYSSQTVKDIKVRFYFLNCKGEYQLLEFPLEKVNVKIDTSAITPFVKFYWVNNNRTESEYNKMYENDITRIVIHCRENDFQPNININNLK